MPKLRQTSAGIISFLAGYILANTFFLEWLIRLLGGGGSNDLIREIIGDILIQLVCFVPPATGWAFVLVALVARSERFKAWPPLTQLVNLCVICLICGIVAYFPLQLFMVIAYSF